MNGSGQKALLLDGVIRPPILYIAVVHVITGILSVSATILLNWGQSLGKMNPKEKHLLHAN